MNSNASPKAIVFLSMAYSPLFGGTEIQVQRLAERWAAEGQTVCVLTRRVAGSPNREILNGVEVTRLAAVWAPGLSWITLGFSTFVWLFRRRRSIDCFIGQMLNALTLPALIFSGMFNIPLLLRPSAGGQEGNLQTLRRSRFGRVKVSFFLRRSRYLIAINQEIERELLAMGVPRERVKVIPNGLDTQKFERLNADARQTARRILNLSDDLRVVLSVGRLEKVKNLEFLIGLWPTLLQSVPRAYWLIVGEGAERSALERQVAQAGLGQSIRFVGFQKQTKDYYRVADVFVLPSHREGISNALLEAMAMGLPVLASDVGGNRDVLKRFPELLLNPNDTDGWNARLTSLLSDDTQHRSLQEPLHQTVVNQYSLETISQAYKKLIRMATRFGFARPLPILAYHRVQPNAPYVIDVSVMAFRQQMFWLKRNGYQSLSLSAFRDLLETDHPFPPKQVVITFDDGHRDFYEHAYPILKEVGFSATIFVNSGFLGTTQWIGGRKPDVVWQENPPSEPEVRARSWRCYEFLSWDQVKELSRNGIEIASHGVTHPFLTLVSDDELRHQLSGSKQMLEKGLNLPVNFFCYPAGDYDQRVKHATEEAGYQAAVATQSHYALTYHWDDAYAWERIGIWRDVSFWKFCGLVRGWYPKVYRALPAPLWHSTRFLYRRLLRREPAAQL